MTKEKTVKSESSQSKWKGLGARLASAAVGIALCLLVFLALPVWCCAILETVLCFFIAYELSCNSGLIRNNKICAVTIMQALIIPWIIYFECELSIMTAAQFVFIFTVMLIEIISKEKSGIQGIFTAYFSAFVLPVFISLLVPIMKLENGRYLVLIPFIASWAGDTGAYFVGSKFGKHKLAPAISPNKSVEGVFGAISGGVVGMLIYGHLLTFTDYEVNWILYVVLGLLGAVLGLSGDLFLSYIKRECKIKDFGNLLPGHGECLTDSTARCL